LGGGVGVEIVRQIAAALRGERKITAAQAIQSQLEVHDVLRHLCDDTGAHSVVMIESQNGAALQRPGQVMYVTVTCEAVRTLGTETQRRFLGVPVDPGYHLALNALLHSANGMVSYRRDDFPSPTIRDMYTQLGITGATMVRVSSTPNIIRYLVVRYIDYPGELTATQRNRLSQAASIISAVLVG
jgi:hypothetical protein